MAVQSFTPSKASPSFSGLVNEIITIVTYLTTTVALTVSDVLGGFIVATNAGAITATLPAAASLVPQIPGAQVGSAIRVFVKCGGAGTVTVAAGTGVTITGTATVATTAIKEFLLVVTAVGDQNGVGATYTAYSLGTSTF